MDIEHHIKQTDKEIFVKWVKGTGTALINSNPHLPVISSYVLPISKDMLNLHVMTHRSLAMIAYYTKEHLSIKFIGKENKLEIDIPITQLPEKWSNEDCLKIYWKAILQYYCLSQYFKDVISYPHRTRKYMVALIISISSIPITNCFPITSNSSIIFDNKGVKVEKDGVSIYKLYCLEKLTLAMLESSKVF